MIRNKELWEKWEKEQIKKEPLNFKANLALLDALYTHARALGAFPPPDPLQGIDCKIQMARALNVSKNS